MKKIQKWLESRGYQCVFVKTENWSSNAFYRSRTVVKETYFISNGMYIRFKPSQIVLYKNEEDWDNNNLLDFWCTAQDFITRAEKYFPIIEKN